jgi:hypothetical protein
LDHLPKKRLFELRQARIDRLVEEQKAFEKEHKKNEFNKFKTDFMRK